MKKQKPLQKVSCAIYSRKSTSEGLDMEFNSLDAQRDACEAYIISQKQEGWILVPDRYDDGGFSGGNIERPALKRLLNDIQAGRINTVVVYKIDRLSRSLKDFTKLVETFDNYQVSFVSVTQSFSTATSMGRLTLNILLSFAQFELELGVERVRDKFEASRKKGMWMGGTPPLGYDVIQRKLIVNSEERKLIRHIFQRFTEIGSTTLLVKELDAKGYHSKSWTTATTGRLREGRSFNKGTIYKILNNRLYRGEAIYKGDSYPGEHDAIIDVSVWDKVHSIFKENSHQRSNRTRAQSPALLKGFIYCQHCHRAMTPTYTRKKGGKQYRYYLCMNAAKKGHDACPIPCIPAGDIETLVFDHVRALIRTPELVANTWRVAKEHDATLKERDIVAAMNNIDPVWDELFPAEQARLLQLLVERVNVGVDNIEVKLRVAGMNSLVRELDVPAAQRSWS